MPQSEELLKVYFEEGEELIAQIEGTLLMLEREPSDREALNNAFRCAHTLKGNSAMLGFTTTSNFTHALETEFDRFRKGAAAVTPERISSFLSICDFLRQLVGNDHRGEPVSSQRLAEMTAVLEGHAAPAKPTAAEPAVPDLVSQQGGNGFELFDPAAPAPPAKTPGFRVRIAPQPESKAAGGEESSSACPRPAEARTIRVDTHKIEGLVNLAGEISVMQSMLSELAVRRDAGKFQQLESAISQIDRSTRELQQRVLSVRMMPVGMLLGGYTRLVRDLATSQRKQISLMIAGEEAELDRAIMEQVRDPLTHIIRNAIDHGIELPEERLARGKPATGLLELRASQEGSKVVISVADDGAGINKARVLEKAIAIGLISQYDELAEDEIHSLIFQAGFSTVENITTLSGRGVGMDVVKRNIELIGGEITIKSVEGRGTSVILHLPLTLAIIEGLVARIGSESYIIPSAGLVETRRPQPEDVKTAAGSNEVIRVRDRYLPLVRAHQFFRADGAETEPHRGICLVVQYNERQYCVLVDEVMGYQQVVIKSLGRFFSSLPGISSAAILADGRIALIIDIPSILKQTVLLNRKIA